MYSVTQVLQRCKENIQRDSAKNDVDSSYRVGAYDPRYLSPRDQIDMFQRCDNKAAMEYLQSVCDITFFPRIGMCPTNELHRVMGGSSVMQMLPSMQRDMFEATKDITRMSPPEISSICDTPSAMVANGKYVYFIGGNPNRALAYSSAREYLWTPRVCLMLMIRAGGSSSSTNRYHDVCKRVRRDWMVAVAQLEQEFNRKAAEEASRRRAEERLQKVLDAQKKETEKFAVAEQHTPTEKPKPEPRPEPPKVSDDSKVVINMTPDLLTVMIKTAVTESVNAVWQKFMDNREIFMNT